MGAERRRFARLKRPLDGSFKGLSGATPCRIEDIGWGGCFISTVSTPQAGEETVVSLPIGNRKIEITGRVLYVERTMGFAVVFYALTDEQIDRLSEVLGEVPALIRGTAIAAIR